MCVTIITTEALLWQPPKTTSKTTLLAESWKEQAFLLYLLNQALLILIATLLKSLNLIKISFAFNLIGPPPLKAWRANF